MTDKLIPTESLVQFYTRIGQDVPSDLLRESGKAHFNVREALTCTRKTPFNRRDYFKICLSQTPAKASGILLYNEQEIPINQCCLIFTNPAVPTSIEVNIPFNRFYCLFNAPFIEGCIPADIQYASPLFNPSLMPVIPLTKEDRQRLSTYFTQMQMLQETDYPFKWDMIRHLLQLVIHEGIRLQQSRELPATMVRDRLVKDFFTLLNQQFPIDSPESPLKLLTPAHFAGLLHVHVNHLNSVVKKHTHKTTREIIHERVITEAKTLLRNTNWNISEIAYALGFEYPSHFNKYFKQQTNRTPVEFRLGTKTAVSGKLP
ncbi:helix-turn-helix domain-containing protein [Chitinophaga varians]|uniref:helix-turn-helix domain-containing protein n=1 Tax=Chitinophaga varians TaxID=2202339 RepID=UPI00165F74A3|nr:helix-turn-helix transcriptional regulator [Chitinophaga varians]MBC9914166.1 helix-turn-helix transcriptional regulator [Chitinophaga varians]